MSVEGHEAWRLMNGGIHPRHKRNADGEIERDEEGRIVGEELAYGVPPLRLGGLGTPIGIDLATCLARAAPGLDQGTVADLIGAAEGAAVASLNARADDR